MTTSCTTASGSLFAEGVTDVVCSTTDAQQRRAQCTTRVTVVVPPQLQGTRFLAFGDSITAGEVSQPARMPRALEPHNSYPTVLTELLRSRYLLQADAIVMANRGVGDERVSESESRLALEIAIAKPDALLLLQGVNDVNAHVPTATIVASLRAMIVRAHSLGVKRVFISTLLPQVPPRHRAFNPTMIEPVNQGIYVLAEREGAVVVDAFAAINPQKATLIGEDGLHPTVEGYRRMAEVFLDAIKNRFEVPRAAVPSGGLFRQPGFRD